ncbi:MAG: hypothetical protein Q9216_006566 [Gyalolechia sp. 2 TL-2023]
MPSDDHRPVKRSSFAAGFDDQIATKRNKLYLSHHKTSGKINGVSKCGDATFADEGVKTLLTRSIGLALDVVGFEASEPLALQSFRVGVEEYMNHFAAGVRQSMLSCRRTQATPQDFLQALHIHQLSLKALLPHLRPPVPKRHARVALPYEPPEEEEEHDHRLLSSIPDDASVKQDRSYVPPHLPAFPGRHTYKATAEYPVREEDPRKIRERATEEGRLGEEALRRLVSAKGAHGLQSAGAGQRVKSIRTKRDELWKETMEAAGAQYLAEHPPDDDNMELDLQEYETRVSKALSSDHGRISSAVNADKKYWRKPAPERNPSHSEKKIAT